MRKENTVLRKLNDKVIISKRVITEIYFDLKHINHGWDKERRDYRDGPARSNFTENEVIRLFEQLNILVQTPAEQKANKKSVESRFIYYIYDKDTKYRMVVDLMKNESTVVVTIY